MGPWTLILFIVSAITGLIYLYLSWNFGFWKKRGVKGPAPKLLYGNFPSIITRNRNLAFDMQDLYEKYKYSGERFIGVFMTRNPQILVINPNLAREIMITHFRAFRDNEPTLWINRNLEEYSGKSSFTSISSKWKENRSEFVGGLSPNKVKQAYPMVLAICEKVTSYLKSSLKNSDKQVDAKILSYKFAIEVVSNFVWGISSNTLNVDENEVPTPMLTMSQMMLAESFHKIGYYYLTGLAPFIGKILNRRFFPEITDRFFLQVQKSSLDLRIRNKNDCSDFLNHMIQLQKKKNISVDDMTGHSLTFLIDAFETAGFTIAYALYNLAINQNSQKRLRAEIMQNLDADGYLDYDVLMDLPYLEQCVLETIRMTTVITVSSRICSEEIYLENRTNHKVKIEPGMTLHIPFYSFHHDPDVFPSPKEFIPERFDNNRAIELNQQGYFLPFGDGPRICSGMKFGQLEAKAMIAEVVKNFHLTKNENSQHLKNDPDSFLLSMSGGMFVDFEAIQK